eukprot:jgi/Bigna1/84110/fgenesh1_pg.123_\
MRVMAALCWTATISALTRGKRVTQKSAPPRGADPKNRKYLDHYSRQAKVLGCCRCTRICMYLRSEGYLARSVYKLQEIDDKFNIFSRGARVFDMGCSPGSWTQLAAERVGSEGFVMGIDLTECGPKIQAIPHVLTMQGDIYDFDPNENGVGKSFDVLISDMAPKTSGIKGLDSDRSCDLCMRALDLAEDLIKPKGSVLLKIFQGGSFDGVLSRCRDRYQFLTIANGPLSCDPSRHVGFWRREGRERLVLHVATPDTGREASQIAENNGLSPGSIGGKCV